MRAILLFALLAPIMAVEVEVHDTAALPGVQPRILESQIIAILERIRTILLEGHEGLGIPILDPVNIDSLKLDLDELDLQGLSGKLSVKDINGAGIAGWIIDNLKISITIIPIGAKIVADFNWPTGEISGTYDSDLSVFGHSIKGAGSISGDLSKLRFEVQSQAGINPISVKSATLRISAESAHLVVENLTIDDKDISGPLADLAERLPTILSENEDLVNELVKDVGIPLINAVLKAITGGKKY